MDTFYPEHQKHLRAEQFGSRMVADEMQCEPSFATHFVV